MFLVNLFVVCFYQPLFNLLVAIYNLIAYVYPQKVDMGIAVIIFTIAFRILWLPISLASDRPEKEKREIAQKVTEINEEFSHDPVRAKKEVRNLLRSHPGPVVASAFDLFFQVLIALMLYRMFTSGLEGADFHLLYKFIPQPNHPFNLFFLGKYDLANPNITLNIVQSIFILVAELLSAFFSPFPTTRRDLSTVIFLPIISFLIFMTLPAGKKLFIITTLGFSITLMLVKQLIFLYHSIGKSIENFTVNQALKKKAE
jgi:YidC/Oxa1 family membrane protein insertase